MLEFGESEITLSKTGVATLTYNENGKESNTSEFIYEG